MTNDQEREAAQTILAEITRLTKGNLRPLRLMEVCGTHTVAIFRSGLRAMLPPTVELVSGPGCPVCVTADSYMDMAIAYTKREDTIITTFGDMLKVPGSSSSLGREKAAGADIRIVYSPLDSLNIARENPKKKVIFLAVGFETTAPTVAATVISARDEGLKNQFFLTAHKLVPPALNMLLADDKVHIDGFILPGHVAVVTGTDAFGFLTAKNMPAAIAGFTPLSILRAVYRLTKQIADGKARLENEYESVVRAEGNITSRRIVEKVFIKTKAPWRGIGLIKDSGLKLKEDFAAFDIEKVLPIHVETTRKQTACRCGEVLRGIVSPMECPLFRKACTPLHAIGPCMVSVEGVCAAWFKYGQARFEG